MTSKQNSAKHISISKKCTKSSYLDNSVIDSMAKSITSTNFEATSSRRVSVLPKIALTAVLASLLACGAGLPSNHAWANGVNMPDGSYRYANRDSSTKAQRYVDIKALPCDKNQVTDKNKADRETYGQYYKVEYQFNSQGEWWGGRPFWWASVPKDVDIVDNKVTLHKDEQLTGDGGSKQTGATYGKDAWNQSASRFWFSKNTEKTEFENNWKRMTGEAGGYDNSGDTYNTSTAYMNDTSALIINWESRGNRKSKISFVIKLKDKTEPLKFAAGVYQVMGNWHYTVGKVEIAPTLPEYSKELELNYPQATEIATFGQPTESERDKILSKLWDANKSNTDVLKKLKGMEQTQTEADFKKAVKVNNDGSATITYKDDSKDTISKENLTKRYVPLSERTKITYPALTPVKNTSSLDSTEKTQVENAIKNANQNKNIKSVTVDGNGKATITFDDKIGTPSTKTIEGQYLVKKQRSLADKFTPYYPVPMAVGNPSKLSASEQKTLLEKIYEINQSNKEFMDAIGNPNTDDAKKKAISVSSNGDVTITYTDKSNDKLDGSKMVYKSKPLADLTNITLPARTAVDNAKSLKEEEQNKVRKAILTANNGLKSKLKGNNENSAITFDNDKHIMTVKFSDDSTSTFDYSELAYTNGNPEKPKTETKNNNGYKYNITKIAINDKDKPQVADWNSFVIKFIQDNWKVKSGNAEITTDFITKTDGLLNKLTTTGDSIGNGMQLYRYSGQWIEKNGSNLKLVRGEFGGEDGIVTIYLGDSIEVRKSSKYGGSDLAFSLTKNDCFVSNAAAPQPEELKKEAGNLIDKILQKHGLNDEEINKFKQEHQSEINKIAKPDDLDKIIKSADKHGQDEKKKKDAQKQIENAQDNLGLPEDQKKELKKKIGNETDPEKIREKINEFQKDQDQKKQKEADQKQQQADQQAEQQQKQQQQKDNTKVDTDIQTQNQQEQQDTGKAEEAKKKAELEKQKQAAIDEIRNNDKLKPEQKEQFIKQVDEAQDTDGVNKAKNDATLKGNQNQNAADSSNRDGLDAAKTDAKKKIGELTNLSEQDKKKYQDEVGTADSLDKVAEILNKAEFEDAKAAAKKKIADLKQKGDLTDQEATDLNNRIDKANDLREVEGILEEAELNKAKSDAKSDVDKLTNLNKAQKDALKQKIDDVETDPTSDNLKTVDQAKTAITAVVAKAKELDKKMSDLKTLVDLVNKQKETLKKSDGYKDTSKKNAFDTALTNASTLVDLTKGTNADGAKVDETKNTLENAVKNLGGNTVDKSKLQREIETAYEWQGKNKQGKDDSSIKKNPKYENASKDKKNDFDTALSNAKKVYDQKDASQVSINEAEYKLSKAIDALDGHNKSDLNDAIKKANSKKSEIVYNNASEDKKSAFDEALRYAEEIEKKLGASDVEISKAKDDLDKALNDLNGKVKTSDLEAAVEKAKKMRKSTTDPKSDGDPKYENASKEKKQAVDTALNRAESALADAKNDKSKNTPEQKQKAIDEALNKLNDAISNLDGVDKTKLTGKLTEAKGKKDTPAYKNASNTNSKALDDAIASAENIVNKAGATEKEISDAINKLTKAIDGLDGHDISDLHNAVDNANTKKSKVSYKNANQDKRDNFDKALKAAEEILKNPNGKTEQAIKTAKDNLEIASNELDGVVDTSKLQSEVTKDTDIKDKPQYKNSDKDKQTTFDQALIEAQNALSEAKNNKSQKSPEDKQSAVDNALKNLQTAASSLNGADISALQEEIALEGTVRMSSAYLYDTSDKKTAYNDALQDARDLVSKLADISGTGKDLASKTQSERQALVDSALKKLQRAKNALTGVAPAQSLSPVIPVNPEFEQKPVPVPTPDTTPTPEQTRDSGFGVNDNAPAIVDKGELHLQIEGAESDLQSSDNANGSQQNNVDDNSGNSINSGNVSKSTNSGNGVTSSSAAKQDNASNDNGSHDANIDSGVENSPAVKQADIDVSKAKSNVDSALAEAKKVAADPHSTQEQVNAAVEKLSAARKALLAAKSRASQVRDEVRAQVIKNSKSAGMRAYSNAEMSSDSNKRGEISGMNTGSVVAPTGLLASLLAAAGALFAARRGGLRKNK
ncbi:GA module-containing protein [Gardnerella vaginalis]|uniref:GA module-containing protein n=1 Tax=Gardnerella vaginalis TaxID=2702 RepID=UPI00157290D1|nr:GA module-containing protein [Gardnerella vaginalis]NSX27445.1 GA module-containing protein [Gardnerella vaginalis]